jgi:hypothetical protein
MKLNEFKEKTYNEFIEIEKELYAELNLLQENIQLLDEVGKTHIILLNWYDIENPRVATIGDTAYSKYGEYGIIQHIEFSENWYDCKITIQTDDGELITHTANRFH